MFRPSQLKVPAIIACPKCGFQASAEPIQLQGQCSLICPNCGYHFYATPKINGVAEVLEGEKIKVIGLAGLKARNTI